MKTELKMETKIKTKINPESQTGMIYNYMKSGHSISPLKALRLFGCFRLGARIYDLKKSGCKIKAIRTKLNDKHFAVYSLCK